MGNAQLLADTGLLMTLSAEANALASDSSEIVEAVMVESLQGFVLHTLTALRDKKHLVGESLLHELAQSVKDARHCRSPQVIVSEERGIGSVVHSVDDDAADIDTKRFCIQHSVLLIKVRFNLSTIPRFESNHSISNLIRQEAAFCRFLKEISKIKNFLPPKLNTN